MSLPTGFRLRLTDKVQRFGGGTVLFGGSPLTAMRLGPRARALLADDRMTVTDASSAHLADRLLATNLAAPELVDTDEASPDDLTVVIPVRDRPDQLDRALTALRGLRCLVVDDASQHPDRVEKTARLHDAEYYPLDVNVGPAAARNIGLARTNVTYVAFVDSDVQVTADALLRLTRHFTDPQVVLVAPKVVGNTPGPGSRSRWFHRYERDHSSLTLGDVPAVVRPGATVAWVPSACVIARTAALGDGFDATLRVGEDVDLVWRLTAAGHRVRYDPTVEASHDSRATLTGWLGRKAFYGTGSALLGTRHGPAIAPAVLTPTYAAAAAAVLARHRLAAPLTAYALVDGTRRIRGTLPRTRGRNAASARIAARVFGWTLRQESALLLCHWWPAALGACVISRSTRRAVLTALVIDSIIFAGRSRLRGRQLSSALAARRLDDLAYGAGLWAGAARHRSTRALRPVRPRRHLRLGEAVIDHGGLQGDRCDDRRRPDAEAGLTPGSHAS
jgi:mycofactocin system glycosyltransferase